jgi:hypothetical protein
MRKGEKGVQVWQTKWIGDMKLVIDDVSILHVLRPQDATIGWQGRRDDHPTFTRESTNGK